MFPYIKKYLHFAVAAALFMVLEVTMDLMQPSLMSRIVDEGVLGLATQNTGDFSIIIKLGSMMVFFAFIGCLGGSLNNILVNYSSQNIGNLMRKDVFGKILSLSFSQIDKIGTGALITRITNDISQVENFISIFVRGMVRTGLILIGSLYCMFRINTDFGLIALGIIPFILVSMLFAMRKVEPFFLAVQEGLDKINCILQEDIAGIRIIKAYTKELYEKVRFGKANDELLAKQFKILVLFAFLHPVANCFMYLGIAILIWNGGKAVSAGTSTPGSIMAAITYTTQLLHSVLMVVFIIQNISRGQTSWKRVKAIIETNSELTDGTLCSSLRAENVTEGDVHQDPPPRMVGLPTGMSACKRATGCERVAEVACESKTEGTAMHSIAAVEFKNVFFGYSKEEPILKNINLRIEKGETLAIMGATGCGKSSLVNLISRFYDVDFGQVLVDGIDVKDYKIKDLRDKISMVLQKAELFSDSIAGNIKWGKPEASDEEVKESAIIAQADSFIKDIPETYENIVAERGMSLSGGQRQRISIARAVLKSAEIMILDDSTSALDLKTESNFYEALTKAKPDCTKIIIAQRIASVKRANRIVILENASICACGSHDELLKSCDIYKDIYNSQMGEEAKNG
jgi:ATP-binding cassette subfamily B protein